MRRMLFLLLPLTLLPGGRAGENGPAKSDDLVSIQKGTLPIIVSVPHGGRKPIPDVPERLGVGVKLFAKVRDANTSELAERFIAALEKQLDGKVWYAIARFDRKHLDVNRPREGAYEDEKAKPMYDVYHGALEAACKAVKEKHGRGLLLDIHGQAPFPDAICRGTQNGKTVTLLKARFGWPAVVGKNSVLGKLEAGGYKIMPKCDGPADAKEEPRFNGGHTVATYGSHAGYAIDAIQLELGGDLRAKDKYRKTAKDIAAAVAMFHDEYLRK